MSAPISQRVSPSMFRERESVHAGQRFVATFRSFSHCRLKDLVISPCHRFPETPEAFPDFLRVVRVSHLGVFVPDLLHELGMRKLAQGLAIACDHVLEIFPTHLQRVLGDGPFRKPRGEFERISGSGQFLARVNGVLGEGDSVGDGLRIIDVFRVVSMNPLPGLLNPLLHQGSALGDRGMGRDDVRKQFPAFHRFDQGLHLPNPTSHLGFVALPFPEDRHKVRLRCQ